MSSFMGGTVLVDRSVGGGRLQLRRPGLGEPVEDHRHRHDGQAHLETETGLASVTALTVSKPSAPPPTSPAMMTIARTIMITWLTPAMIVGAARGMRTPYMVWRRVAPKVCDASIALAGTCRIPGR